METADFLLTYLSLLTMEDTVDAEYNHDTRKKQ
jgi:hypothetical protein